MDLLDSRVNSLRRRANSLPDEIEQWLSYAEKGGQFEKNFSQIEALNIFMEQLSTRLEQTVSELDKLASHRPPKKKDLLAQAELIERNIRKAQYIWDYFRSKLSQRFVPQLTDALFVADLVSNDCYRTVMNKADHLRIKHKLGLRDYPLTYLLNHSSPVTWVRNTRLNALDYQMLPIPIIGVPWDHIVNPWELLSLHHEVSHDVDIDLGKPSQELGLCLKRNFESKGTSKSSAEVWNLWSSEIFADFLGILLGGPAFVSFLASFMTLPAHNICTLDPTALHPTPYLRILLNCHFVKVLELGSKSQSYIEAIRSQWKKVYGAPTQDMKTYIANFDDVVNTFLSTKLRAFEDEKGKLHALCELVSFDKEDFEKQLLIGDALSDQTANQSIPIRHIIGAAYMAIEKLPSDDDLAENLAKQMNKLIRERAPEGQLALRTNQSEKILKQLADDYFANPLPL